MKDNELLTRAVEEVVPMDLAKKKLAAGKPIRVYLGIDPTGNKLHLGHSVPLRKLKAFQDAGHEVIFVIGSFTAMIGDPTGRDIQREPLTSEQIWENFKTYEEQASKVIDLTKIEKVYLNDQWLNDISLTELVKLSSHFTVQQMLERDMYQKRMREGKPIAFNEFIYPLLQGYDSMHLDVDCEIGGNDQLFNMLCGRKLQEVYRKRDKFVLTTKLIEGTDGRKMSKTYDNCIWLEDTSEDMFGKTMRIKDDLILTYMECCTDIPMKEIKNAEKSMKEGTNPKDFKEKLAFEITKQYYNESTAMNELEAFRRKFTKKVVLNSDVKEMDAMDLKDEPKYKNSVFNKNL